MIPGYQTYKTIFEGEHASIVRGIRQDGVGSNRSGLPEGHPVVLKMLSRDLPSLDELEHFRREYAMTMALQGDGIIEIFAMESFQNTLFLVLEDFNGYSLDIWQKKAEGSIFGAYTPPTGILQFLGLATRIAEIVGRVHQQNIMHKDLNPSNILWNPHTKQVRLIDFGISSSLQHLSSSSLSSENSEGTIAYMSPEQLGRMDHVVDFRSDLYSLGVTFYELLTGRLPFETQDLMKLVHAHLAIVPPPPHELDSNVPEMVSKMVLKLMSKRIEDRYQNMDGLLADLNRCTEELKNQHRIGTFSLGEKNMLECFNIPSTLYGREHELHQLLGIFERACKGTKEVVAITGYAGIGKSALVYEMKKNVHEKHGIFVSGKFDQFKQNVPFAPLIQAFQKLIEQLLAESEESLSFWKKLLLDALGPNGKVIIDVIPILEQLIGPQPNIPELSPIESQNRFNWAFQSFVRTFSTEHPLVVFLDDMHRADMPTLNLLKLFLADSKIHSCLFILAYRDKRVDENHIVNVALKNFQKMGTTVLLISLPPLSLVTVNQLVADTLLCDLEKSMELAKVCYEKTQGNPFFLKQFLQSIRSEGLLRFEIKKRLWTWDLESIRQTNSTDNVVDLMTAKIRRLSAPAQEIIRLASCIGNRFDLATLSIVHEHAPAETASILQECLDKGLIERIDEQEDASARYLFLHDRVQQAAHRLIPQSLQKLTHLRIGRLLLQATEQEVQETGQKWPEVVLQEIVNHLNQAIDCIENDGERVRLAQLNLIAGRKAESSTAFEAAFEHFQAGIGLLSIEHWDTHHELIRDLHGAASESALMNGKWELVQSWATPVLEHAKNPLDKVKVCEILIRTQMSQNHLWEVVHIGLDILSELGVPFPARTSKRLVNRVFKETHERVMSIQIENLLDLPKMTDPRIRAAVHIMTHMGVAVYSVKPELYELMVFKIVELSIEYGNTGDSAMAYARLGLTYCRRADGIDKGYRCGKMALMLLKYFTTAEVGVRLIYVVNLHIRHWKEHLQETLPSLFHAYHLSMELGELAYAGLNGFAYCFHRFLSGVPLQTCSDEMTTFEDAIGQFRENFPLTLLTMTHQTVLNLIEPKGDPIVLSGSAFDADKMVPFFKSSNIGLFLFTYYFFQLFLSVYFRKFDRALAFVNKGEKYLQAVPGFIFGNFFRFYASLALLKNYPDGPEEEQNDVIKHVLRHLKKLKNWAKHAPMNYQQKWALVEAELARVQGKTYRAWEFYDKAIQWAKEHDYTQDEALANEFAAAFFREIKRMPLAEVYHHDAYGHYSLWGSREKVRLLKNPSSIESTGSSVAPIPHGLSQHLDLTAVMKASQAISEEIDLEILLKKLIQIVIENAGAQKGYLLLEKNGSYQIAQETLVDRDKPVVPSSRPMEVGKILAESVVHFVVHTHDAVVLNDASSDHRFSMDPYIVEHHPQSILCGPILHHGKVTGVVYLENNLTPHAFSKSRLEVLQLLSAQAAISIENASLYSSLKTSDRAKSDFLANISHEIRTPLNAVIGFCELLSSLLSTEKQHTYLEGIQTAGKNLRSLINDILDFSKIESGMMKITPVPMSLHTLFDEIRQIFEAIMQEKGLQFTTDIAPAVPERLLVDESKLRQILLNLVGNAMKFTDKGYVRVTAAVAKKKLVIFVEDSGIGIPHEDWDKIFESFQQRDGQSNRKYGGTGLGLALCKRLAELMNGEILMTSEVNVGSTFEIVLSAVESLTGEALKEAEAAAITKSPLDLEVPRPSAQKFSASESISNNLSELVVTLENEVYPQWQRLEKKQRMKEVRQLGIRIRSLGTRYGTESLFNLGERLCRSVDDFDILLIRKILQEIPTQIESIKNSI